MRKPSGKRPWTDDEVRLLIKLWTADLRTSAIAESLGRSAGSVRSKARRLGLYRRSRRDLIKAMTAAEQAADTTAPPVPVEAVAEVTPDASPGLLALSPNTTVSVVPVTAVEESATPTSSRNRCSADQQHWLHRSPPYQALCPLVLTPLPAWMLMHEMTWCRSRRRGAQQSRLERR